MAQAAQTERRPVQLRADCEEAREILRAGGKLPWRLWAAWMSQMTGLHTYEVCRNVAKEIVGFGTTLILERTLITQGPRPSPEGRWNGDIYATRDVGSELNYLRPSQIAAMLYKLQGTAGEILDRDCLVRAIMELDDKEQRIFALEACHALARDHEGVPAPVEILRQVGNLAGRLAAPAAYSPTDTPRPGGKQLAMPVLTEPREVFEAELARLKEGKARAGSLVGEFFGEEGGAE